MICAEKESRELSCEIKRRAYPTHLNPPLRVLMAFLQLGVFFKTVLATVTVLGDLNSMERNLICKEEARYCITDIHPLCNSSETGESLFND